MDVVVWAVDPAPSAKDIVEALVSRKIGPDGQPVTYFVRGVKVIDKNTGREVDRWGQVE